MASPFASYANATLNFQVASGTLTPDSKGNLRPGSAIVEVTALLQQKRDPNEEMMPGVDKTAVWVEGYIVSVANQESLVLPTVVTPDSPCAATWQGRQGRFYMQFQARNPYLAALSIDLVERLKGYFQIGSFVVSGDPWEPTPTPEPTDSLQLTRQLLTVTTTGQTVFSLSAIAASPQLSELYVNGVKATYGAEYSINNTTLTWLMTSLQLQPSDEFEILYYTQP